MDIRALTGQQLVSYYLMASYLYYNHDLIVISDHEFDEIVRRLLKEFASIEHPHKHLITKDDLDAGTGYRLTDAVAPLRLKLAAWHWYDSSQPKETP